MEIKAHDYPQVYSGLGIDLRELGCVMADLEPIQKLQYPAEVKFYTSKDPKKFWVKGLVADKNPHVTLLYGLIQKPSKISAQIHQVLTGYELTGIEFDHFDKFDSPYPDEPYYCVIGHVKVSEKLLEGHQRLSLLPHINTFGGYKPHVTIAYIEKDDAAYKKFVSGLNEQFAGKALPVKCIKLGK